MPIHPNGGGWVDCPKNVAPTAYVGIHARILDNARVFGDASVMEHATVCGDARVVEHAKVRGSAVVAGRARVGGHSVVGGHAMAEGDAVIDGYAEITGSAHICGRSRIYGVAIITGGRWFVPPRYIQGSRDAVWTVAPGVIAIGCQTHTIAHWREHYADISRQHRYTPAEIAEYGQYLALPGWVDFGDE